MSLRPLALINQPAGLGDILYTLKIAVNLIRTGFKVIWPVIPEYIWIKRHIFIEHLSFILPQELNDPLLAELYTSKICAPYKHSNIYYLPLRYVLHNPSYAVVELPMFSKYIMADMEEDSFNWWDVYSKSLILSCDKGKLLYDRIVQYPDYNIMNSMVGSPDGIHLHTVNPIYNSDINKYHIVPLQILDGFSIFDWYVVLDRAHQLHTPDTSLCFVVDILRKSIGLCANTRAFMYPRDPNRPNVPLYLTSCFNFESTGFAGWLFNEGHSQASIL